MPARQGGSHHRGKRSWSGSAARRRGSRPHLPTYSSYVARLPPQCSFCGRSQDQVRRIVGGPGAVAICDGCIELCTEIIHEDLPPKAGPPIRELRSRWVTFKCWFRNLFRVHGYTTYPGDESRG